MYSPMARKTAMNIALAGVVSEIRVSIPWEDNSHKPPYPPHVDKLCKQRSHTAGHTPTCRCKCTEDSKSNVADFARRVGPPQDCEGIGYFVQRLFTECHVARKIKLTAHGRANTCQSSADIKWDGTLAEARANVCGHQDNEAKHPYEFRTTVKCERLARDQSLYSL